MKIWILGFVAGILCTGALYVLLGTANAHTPCGNDVDQWKPPPVCKHILVANPYTGLMETQYVCD